MYPGDDAPELRPARHVVIEDEPDDRSDVQFLRDLAREHYESVAPLTLYEWDRLHQIADRLERNDSLVEPVSEEESMAEVNSRLAPSEDDG